MATWRVIEWRGLRLDFDRGLNREFHGSRIELQEGIIMDFKKFITDLAAIYRMPTARTPVGPIVDVDAVHEVGRKAGHEAGHAEGYEAGYNKVWGTATSFPCSWAFLARARIIPKLRRGMHAEVGAVMIGLSRLGFKTLIVACAIASVAFPQAGFAQQPATPPVTKTTVTAAPVVFAAASMETALDAIAGSWAAQSGRSPSIVYASSAALAKQIEQGAPADIFISADTNWMDYLDNKKLIQPGTRHDLLGNTLVLIEPADSRVTLKIEPGFDLIGATGDSKIAVCIIESCPGGIYAKQALEKLGVWQKVEPKLEQVDNVRAALNLVSRGEVFGIVYATDAKAQPKVKVVDTFPESTHSQIIYPVAIVRTSKNLNTAAFLAFLSSQKAIKILTEQGFTFLSN